MLKEEPEMKRRKWTPEEKMNIVLAGLKGDVSVAELCRRYNISQTLYYRWRDTFLQRGLEGLSISKMGAGIKLLRSVLGKT
jgi:transposase-like protein